MKRTITNDNERLSSRYHKICRNYIQALVASKTVSEKSKKRLLKAQARLESINQRMSD